MQRSWLKNPLIIGILILSGLCILLGIILPGPSKLDPNKTPTTQSTNTNTGPTSTPKATYVATRTATPTPTLTPTPLPVGAGFSKPAPAKGPACVNASGKLSCLDGSAWHTIPMDFVTKYAYIYDMAACPDGKLLVGHSEGASLWDGKTWSQLLKSSSGITIHQVACSSDGIKWVAGNAYSTDGIIRFSGSNQEKFKFEQILANTGLDTTAVHITVQDMLIMPHGDLWALITMNYNEAYPVHFDGSNWQYVANAPKTLLKLASTSKGQLWAIDNSKVYQYSSGTWNEFTSKDDVFRDIFIDTDDRVWLSTKGGNVLVLDHGTWLTYDATDSERISGKLTSIAIDGQGRLWVGSEWGLNIFDGSRWTAFDMTNSDIVDFSILDIVIFIGGPDLPTPVKKEAGSASGIIKLGETPVAYVTIEICQKHFGQFITYYGTPCDGERLYHFTFSSGEGTYHFDNLPPGFYSTFYKVPDVGWEFGPVFTVEAGKEVQIKDIEVEEE